MSFLDALIPGSQKYDLYAKSISLQATVNTASVVGNGPVVNQAIVNPPINVPITITSLSGIDVLQIASFQIPSTAITAAPGPNALIQLTIADTSLDQVAFTAPLIYKLSNAANYVAGTVTKTLGNSNIDFAPATGAGFPQPPDANTPLQIVSSPVFVVIP